MGKGNMDKAKEDFMRAYELTDGKDQEVIKGLHDLKAKIAQQKQKEIEFSQNMINKMKDVEMDYPKPTPKEEEKNEDLDEMNA